jgi:signal transduction histidine kinase
MKRLWPDRIVWRIAVTVVLALAAVQAVTFGLATFLRPGPVPLYSARWLGERTVAIVDAVQAVPIERRAEAVASERIQSLGGEWLEITWQPTRPAVLEEAETWQFRGMPRLIARMLGDRVAAVHVRRLRSGQRGLVGGPRFVEIPTGRVPLPGDVGPAPGDLPIPGLFTLFIEARDGSWLTIAAPRPWQEQLRGPIIALWLLVIAATVALISFIAARRIVVPLEGLAEAARRFGTDRHAPALAERGPRETRIITRAFNEMRERIGRFVGDRTQMIAAISHDLRTPLTRMRLRAENVGDPVHKEKMLADIAEMEAMIAATLDFAAEDTSKEPATPTDIAALVNSVCDDAADSGGNVSFAGPAPLVLRAQPTALKRAFANLIGNAVRHGGNARVTLADNDDAVGVTIEDDGPGIPDDQLERVFQPFYRLDRSRSRATGGAGLGLAVARTVVRAHGGDIRLANRCPRGLTVAVSLPKSAA